MSIGLLVTQNAVSSKHVSCWTRRSPLKLGHKTPLYFQKSSVRATFDPFPGHFQDADSKPKLEFNFEFEYRIILISLATLGALGVVAV